MYPWISRTLDVWLQFCEKKCGLYMDVNGLLSTVFVTFPHFISTFSQLYHSQCRYATFSSGQFSLLCLLHIVLWDRKVFWIGCGVSEMIRSNQVEMTEERERVGALFGACMFSALFRKRNTKTKKRENKRWKKENKKQNSFQDVHIFRAPFGWCQTRKERNKGGAKENQHAKKKKRKEGRLCANASARSWMALRDQRMKGESEEKGEKHP